MSEEYMRRMEQEREAREDLDVCSFCKDTVFGIPLEKLHGLIQKIKEFHPEWMEN